jgi:xylulokinase
MVVMGGGANSTLWCQLLSDILQRPVARARTTEATALGAGILATLGSGLHADLETAVARMTGAGERFTPGRDAERYAALYSIYTQLYPALRPTLAALASL